MADDPAKGQKEIQEAADKAAEALSKLTAQFRELGSVGNSALQQITSKVALFNPAVFSVFTFEVRNLGAAVGSLLTPALTQLTDLARQLNVWITNLSPGTKQLVAGLAAGAAVAGLFATGLRLVSGPFLQLGGWVRQTATSLGLFGTASKSAGASAAAGGAGLAEMRVLFAQTSVASQGMSLALEAVSANVAELTAVLGAMAVQMGLTDADFASFPVTAAAADVALDALDAGADATTASFSLLDVATGGILPAIGAIATLAIGAATALSVMGGSAGGLGGAFQSLRDAFAPLLDELSALGSAVMDLAGELLTALGDAFGSLIRAAKPFLDFLMAGFRELMHLLEIVIEFWAVLIERIRTGRVFAGGFFDEIKGRVAKLHEGGAEQTYAPGVARTQGLEEASRKLQEASFGAQITKALGGQKEKKPEEKAVDFLQLIHKWLTENLKVIVKDAVKQFAKEVGDQVQGAVDKGKAVGRGVVAGGVAGASGVFSPIAVPLVEKLLGG